MLKCLYPKSNTQPTVPLDEVNVFLEKSLVYRLLFFRSLFKNLPFLTSKLGTRHLLGHRLLKEQIWYLSFSCSCVNPLPQRYLLTLANRADSDQAALKRAAWSGSILFAYRNTVNPLYNDTVGSKLSLTLKWICCYKEIRTITRFPHNNHFVRENIIQMN